MKNSTYIQKKWMQFKVSTLSASITALIVSSMPTQISASDIDIYQSGSTGAINIYFMLDTSGSMGDMNLNKDYGHESSVQDCTVPNMVQSYDYKQKSNGNRRVSFIAVSNGTHKKNGNDYTFVGAGGDYNVVSDNGSGSGTRYERTSSVKQVGTKCESIKICGGTYNSNLDVEDFAQVLPADLTVNSYKYANKDDYYCLVNKTDLDLSNNNDQKYFNKIKSICEKVTENQQYRCFARLSNLKKGLLSLIHSNDVDESKYFAVGQYSGDSSSDLTTPVFLAMNSGNKEKISTAVAGLTAGGGTPIGSGYERSTTGINSSTSGANNTKPACTGNGIYLLTDGEPSSTSGYSNWSTTKPSDITNDEFNQMRNDFWRSVGLKARGNLASGKAIKTATVGFGGEYYLESMYARDGQFECSVYKNGTNATNQSSMCYWGTKKSVYGQGGFYNAQSAEDIVGSIKQFVSDVSVPIEGATMGTSTIPVDALNTTQLQSYSYFPMFKPLIGTENQLWAGNLKKFKVSEGTIVDTQKLSVFDNDKIRTKLQDYWYSAGGSSDDDQFMTWGGHLSRLKVNNLPKAETSSTALNRNLYININGELKKATDILNSSDKPANSHYLYGLLGFSKLKEDDFTTLNGKNYTEQLTYLKDKVASSSGYQMGSVIHSTPVLLTQKGAIEFENGVQSSKDREDYIMFGTTQGVLHIVKAGQQDTDAVDENGGKDVFSFVPQEFLTRQTKGFAESLAMGRTDSVDTFFYGVDGPWVAHTVYEPSISDFYKKDENGDYVIENGQKVIESTRGSLVVDAKSGKSHQYVYGGLRMGGRSYYALNLSDMTKPKLMFHINPDAATLNTDPLYHMGQSWSKPTLTYIKWNGEKKLAMIVGGGYDTKYEDPTFTNSTSGAVKGNGIYIFDAETGGLLWWGSSSVDKASQAVSNTDGTLAKPESTSIGEMVNSIPSRVKAVDRDGDGITDHLYVGDLGGKLFRIDLNSQHVINTDTDKQKPFILNAFALADIGSRRFYEPPVFTIHKSGMTRYAVLSIGSGDRSSPLLPSPNSADLLIGLYDRTVTNTVPTVQDTITLSNLREIYKKKSEEAGHKGWYYLLPKPTVESIVYQNRILEESVALDNDLYVSIFNPQKSTAKDNATSCTGGITGESTIYKFCLPDGDCGATKTDVNKIGSLGSGILGLTVGPGSTTGKRTFIFNKKPDPKPDEYETLNKLLPKRWFEYSPYKIKSEK